MSEINSEEPRIIARNALNDFLKVFQNLDKNLQNYLAENLFKGGFVETFSSIENKVNKLSAKQEEPRFILVEYIKGILKKFENFDEKSQNFFAREFLNTGFIDNLNKFTDLANQNKKVSLQQEQNQVPPQENKSCLLI